MRCALPFLLLAIGAVLLVSYLPTTDYIDVTMNRGHGQPASHQTLQQQAWQSRWNAVKRKQSALTYSVDAVTPLPVIPPKSGQSSEARAAVAEALRQHIPEKGDGRRGGFDDQRNVKRESDTVRRMLRADGLNNWKPDPTQLPPQAPAGASMEELLQHVPVNGTAWLAFGNAGVTEMLMNWVSWVCLLYTSPEPTRPY